MTKPTIYTVAHPDDLSPPVKTQGFCVDMVLASDYAELEREIRAYEATVANIEQRVTELAAENVVLKEACRAAMLQNVTLANEGDIQAGNSLEIPEGYVLVPREPTAEMIAAAMDCDDVLFNSDETFCVQFGNIYDAMIAAAPQEVTSARVHPARDE